MDSGIASYLGDWAKDPKFNRFWKHYEICDDWLREHSSERTTIRGFSDHQNVSCFEGPSVHDEFDGIDEPEVTERLSRCEIQNEIDDETEVDVMSDEMKEFFAKTYAHRQQLKLKREAEKEKEDDIKRAKKHVDYVNVEQITVRGRVEHSADYRNANAEFVEKREKAKNDYGEAATKILAMESALEMKFESEYASNPQLWPNIPFRF